MRQAVIKQGKRGSWRWAHYNDADDIDALQPIKGYPSWEEAAQACVETGLPFDQMVVNRNGVNNIITPPRTKFQRYIDDVVTVVTAVETRTALEASRGKALELTHMDNSYRILPMEAWERLIARSRLDLRPYKSEFFDCDDFAIVFSAFCREKFQVNGCGSVLDWSGGHAYNVLFVATSTGIDVAWLEPQNDVVWDTAPELAAYAMTLGRISL